MLVPTTGNGNQQSQGQRDFDSFWPLSRYLQSVVGGNKDVPNQVRMIIVSNFSLVENPETGVSI